MSDLKELEQGNLENSLQRVQSLVDSTDTPRPLHLGILLALRIAKEMSEGKDPGTDSVGLVAEWADTYGDEIVDESVVFARQFLLKPQELMGRIAKQLDPNKSAQQEASDVSGELADGEED